MDFHNLFLHSSVVDRHLVSLQFLVVTNLATQAVYAEILSLPVPLPAPPLPFSSAKNADAEMDSQLREVINPHMYSLHLQIPGPAFLAPRTVQVSLIRDKGLHRNREGPRAG